MNPRKSNYGGWWLLATVALALLIGMGITASGTMAAAPGTGSVAAPAAQPKQGGNTKAGPSVGEVWNRVAGSGIDYRSISMVDANTGFAVGSDRGISHWNGTDWSDYPTSFLIDFGNTTFNSVSAISGSNAWAVGTAGMNYHWDGSAWTRGYMTGTSTLNGVSMAAAADAWSVDSSGQFWRWTGGNLIWTRFPSTNTTNLNAVYMLSPTEGWAVGSSSNIWHWDGTTWTRTTGAIPNTTTTLLSVHAVSATDIWVSGSGGSIWRSTNGGNAASFTAETTGVTYSINGISMLAGGEGWAAGAATNGTVLHRAGGVWNSTDTTNISSTGQVWNAVATLSSTEGWIVGTPPSANSAATQSARMLRRTGSNTAWNAVRGLQRDNQINSIDALSSTSVYGAGQVGAFEVYSGTTPNELSSYILQRGGTNFVSQINGFDAVNSNLGWAVTSNATAGGNIIRWDGGIAAGGWTTSTLVTSTVAMNGIHMLSDSVGFAVGASGTIYTKSGSGTDWVKRDITTTATLNAVWAIDGNTILAVGASSTILRSTDGGVTWTGFGAVPNTSSTLLTVHCAAGDGTCWAAGSSGVAWKYNSGINTWQAFNYKTTTNINDVWVLSATDAWAVGPAIPSGTAGTILHWDGSLWARVVAPTAQDLKSIHMLSATEGYAAGGSTSSSSGVLLRFGTTGFSAPPTVSPTLSCRSGSDGFGYSMKGPNCPGAPVFGWIPGTTPVRNFSSFDDSTVTSDAVFPYQLYATTYTTLTIGTNGRVGPGIPSGTPYTECAGAAHAFRALLPFAEDLNMDLGDVLTAVVGTAPNRTFVVEWRNARFFTSSRYGLATFELLLKEGSNEWDVQYLSTSGNFFDGTVGNSGINDIPVGYGIAWVCNPTTPAFLNAGYTGAGVAVSYSAPLITPTPTNTPQPTGTPTPFCDATQPLSEGFESGTLGQFSNTGSPGWTAVTSAANSGSFSAFAPDNAGITDQRLTTNTGISIPAGATAASLKFWHRYAFENTTTCFDGGVLEVSTDGGTNWADIGESNFVSGGYNGTIDTGFSNPILGRRAWCFSTNNAFLMVKVNLLSFAGQTIMLRFREGTDTSIAATGWWVDDVEVNLGGACETPTPGGPTLTPSLTRTITNTPTASPTRTNTSTPTLSPTRTLTPEFSPTPCVGGAFLLELEPNNDQGTAMQINPDRAQVSGSIDPIGDIDYYSFQAAAGDRVWAYVYTNDSTDSTDSQLSLRNSLGQEVQFDDDNGSQAGLSSAIAGAYITQTGTYYLRVNDYDDPGDDTIVPYALYVNRTSSAPIPEIEANNTITDANSYAIGTIVTGTISPAGDLDVFKAVVNNGDKLVIHVDGDPERDAPRDGSDTNEFNSDFDILDATGAVLITVNNESSFDDRELYSEDAVFTIVTGGPPTVTLGIRIKAETASATGTYNLHVYSQPKLPCGITPTTTSSPTVSPTRTITNSPTISPTRTVTNSPTITTTPTISPTRTITPTPTATFCASTFVFTEGFETGTLGAFSNSGTPGWAAVSSAANSGTFSAFAPDNAVVTTQTLTLNSAIPIPPSATGAVLTFWHRFTMESGFDGGVLEISTNGGSTWADAGPNITTGGYNGTISTCCTNPLAGRPAWTGTNASPAAFTMVQVNLMPFVGQSVLLRFIEGTDFSVSGTGWWIDDVSVKFGGTCTTLVGHVLWEGASFGQPDSNQMLPITLTLKSGTTEVNYPQQTTDASGFFTVSVTLPPGTYTWRVKGPLNGPGGNVNTGYLARSGTTTISAGVNQQEMGLQKTGDANNDNVVDILDFNLLKQAFGAPGPNPPYDRRADFNYDNVVDILDFNLLKQNFAQPGDPPVRPSNGPAGPGPSPLSAPELSMPATQR
jgi:photosystem II stability/assembly factor-like uncharacterized protein